jgi:hypothetical protein
MGLRTPSASSGPNRSRHDAWPDSCTSRATQCGVTPSATSDATFFNATVDISHATWATSWNFSLGGVSFNILD